MQKHHSFAQHFLLFSTMKFHFSLLVRFFLAWLLTFLVGKLAFFAHNGWPGLADAHKSIGTAYRSTSPWRLTSPPRCGWF